jgi:hypothetical protein
MRAQRGAGTSEVMIIMAFAAYFIFMGYMAQALGMDAGIPGLVAHWQIPPITVSGGTGWLAYILGGTVQVVDILIAVVNLLLWVLQMIVVYVSMIGWSFTGSGMPAWLGVILFVCPSLGMGWLVLSLVRGRE